MDDRLPTPTDLYRYFDAEGRLLYVGISLSAIAPSRAAQAERRMVVPLVDDDA